MNKMIPLSFLLCISGLFSTTSCYSANFINKETLAYGDARYTITAQPQSILSKSDQDYLEEFLKQPDAFAGILCTEDNVNMVKQNLLKIDPTSNFYERSYQNNPWILTPKVFENLPIIDEKARISGAQNILTIEPVQGDIRFVLVKGNKNYVMNCGGTSKPEDVSDKNEENHLFQNIAKRKLLEEITLTVENAQLTDIGYFETTRTNKILDLTYHNYNKIFSCHLNPTQTQEWMKLNNFALSDESITAYSYSGEVQWVYILKPDVLTQEGQIMLPIGNGKQARLSDHHAVMPAVVLKGRFSYKDVLTERNVTYLKGQIESNGVIATFG